MKRTYFGRILAAWMILAALMTLLTGCGKKSDEEQIVGQWSAQVDVSALVKERVIDFDEAYEAADFDALTLSRRAVFNKDGTYTAAIAADGVTQLKTDIAQRMAPVLKERVRNELAKDQKVSPQNITDEQLDGYVGMIGQGNWETMCLNYVEMMSVEELFADDGFAGKYVLRDGRLYLSGAPDAEPGDGSWITPYKVDDRTLTLENGKADILPDFMGNAFPLTFTRLS